MLAPTGWGPLADSKVPKRWASVGRCLGATRGAHVLHLRTLSAWWIVLARHPSSFPTPPRHDNGPRPRKDFLRVPLGTEVGKPTSSHGQAAYNQNKTALAYLPHTETQALVGVPPRPRHSYAQWSVDVGFLYFFCKFIANLCGPWSGFVYGFSK